MGRKKIQDSIISVRIGDDLLVAVGMGSKDTVTLRSTNPFFARLARKIAEYEMTMQFYNAHGIDRIVTAGYGSEDEILAMLLLVDEKATIVPRK